MKTSLLHLALVLSIVLWHPAASHLGAAQQPSPVGASDAAASGKQDDEASPALLPDGSLPWKRRESTVKPEDVSRSARDTLAGFGIGQPEFALFDDGKPFSTAEQEVLLRIVYRLPFMSGDDLARWAVKDIDWKELQDQPAEHRGQVYRLQGRAQQVVKVELPEEKAEIYELPHLWRVTVAVEGAPEPLEVIARDIPQAWMRAGEIDQPLEADGLFIKEAAPNEGEAVGPLTFAADHLGWYPDKVSEEFGVEPVDVYLAKLGLDLSEFDRVTDRTKSLPREPFYQLLAAVGRADRGKLMQYAKPFSLVDLLQKSAEERGHVVDITGHAQQVTKILVDDPDIRERYGIDHYYEIDMFVKLPGGGARIVDPNDESKVLSYQQYPITVCVRELPEGLSEPNKPNVYQTVNRDITLPAVFFKVWAVSTARVRQLGADRKQFNPMFVGRGPQVLEYQQLISPWMGAVLAAVFAVVLVAIWVGVWRSQKGDQRVDKERIRKQFEVEPGRSLDEMGIEGAEGPDFSGLEAYDKGPSPPDA